MPFYDTHCHLNLHSFEKDLPEVIERTRAYQISRIMIPGTSLEDNQTAIRIAEEYQECYAAVGIHPNEATQWNSKAEVNIAKLAKFPKVLAIGEIGLDYYRDHAPHDLQKIALLAQLELAKQIKKPVIIHIRDSMAESCKILFNWQEQLESEGHPLASRPGIFHAFPGTIEEANPAIQHNFKIGVGGPVTFKNARNRHALVTELSLNAIVLETDAPFLTPHPHRGKRNDPSYIPLIAEKIASLKNISVSEVADQTNQNADHVFQWNMQN